MIAVKRRLEVHREERGRQRIDTEPVAALMVEHGRVPRISRLMALAIRFEGMMREGVVADQSELAQLAHVTQPRMTQIMNLLHLAPDIQEALLFLPRVVEGKDAITEKMLRPIAAEVDWGMQCEIWRTIHASAERQISIAERPSPAS
jgi:hypothetical protein